MFIRSPGGEKVMHVNRPDLAHAVGPGRCLVFDDRLDLRVADDHDGGSLHIEAGTGRLDLRQEQCWSRDPDEVVYDLPPSSGRDDAGERTEHRSTGSGTRSERCLHHSQHVLEVGDGFNAARTASTTPARSPATACAASYRHASRSPRNRVQLTTHHASHPISRSPLVLPPPNPALDRVFVQSGQDAEAPPDASDLRCCRSEAVSCDLRDMGKVGTDRLGLHEVSSTELYDRR